jgi:CDP-glycerol glycerophosphotransferase (TagB/SpsB family)
VWIAPHTPRSTMFAETFANVFTDAKILGFVDKAKTGEEIFKLEDVQSTSYDYMLILSANYFVSIYDDHREVIPASKIIKVEIINNVYHFLSRSEILVQKIKLIPTRILLHYLKICVCLVTFFKLRRNSVAFVCENFAGNNLKALLTSTVREAIPSVFLSNNDDQNREINKSGIKANKLYSFFGFWKLATSKFVVQDQGDCLEPLEYLSKKQKKIQMWHGIPLKKLNRLVGMKFDWMISTSKFVNETSLKDVITANEYSELGYPRNDLLLKDHDDLDLILSDLKIYNLAKNAFGSDNKIVVYMPTHRESATSIGQTNPPLFPLDLENLDTFCVQNDIIFILKLHPFIMQFQKDFDSPKGFKNVYFHSTQGDIYPTLKYTDLLVTDYSSIYFDFLLLNRPIIFYDYDYEEYSSNMGGFFYNYEENAPGLKVKTQSDMQEAILQSLNYEDSFAEKRKEATNRFHTHIDENSSNRIIKSILR